MMYAWRKMTPEERAEVLAARKVGHRPWHSPPHRFLPGTLQYIISAACYEHAPIIGQTAERMDALSDLLYSLVTEFSDHVFAWCVLPNHYHAVLQTAAIKELLHALALMHGRTSFTWNGEDRSRGRRVWCNDVEREMRSQRHLWASINYVHHNAVKHGYVERWQDWAWSSAMSFLDDVGLERAKDIWQEYPVKDYGKNWDD
jgi:putative transposase